MILIGVVLGFMAWFAVRYLLAGFFTVAQNERAPTPRARCAPTSPTPRCAA